MGSRERDVDEDEDEDVEWDRGGICAICEICGLM